MWTVVMAAATFTVNVFVYSMPLTVDLAVNVTSVSWAGGSLRCWTKTM